ncbi:hypothetical protein Y695_04691 [Hydrogenophaga sp. T4]|nr:hypothetical protein Y695_04691 [Hydrogenophaga sp. T4]
MARPMATRWRWPPESSLGVRCRYCVRFRMRAAFCTLSSTIFGSTLASLSAKLMFSYTLMCGYSA